MSATCSRTRTTSCSPGRSQRSWRSGPRNLGIDPDEVDRRVADVAATFGLTDRLAEHPYRLGYPIRKLVGIASVVAMQPSILVLDEPTTGQDHRTSDAIRTVLQDVRDTGVTIVCVTHDMELVAALADRLVVLRDGRVEADGTARAVFADTATMAATRLRPPQITRSRWRCRAWRAIRRPWRSQNSSTPCGQATTSRHGRPVDAPARTVDRARSRDVVAAPREPARQAHLAPGGDRVRAGHVRPGPAAGRRRARVRRLRRRRDRGAVARGVLIFVPVAASMLVIADAGARRVWGDLHRDRRGRSAEPLWSRHAARPVARRTHPGRRGRRARRPRDHPSVRPVRRARPPPRPVPFQLHAVDDAAARADPPARGLDRARRPTVARDAEQRLRGDPAVVRARVRRRVRARAAAFDQPGVEGVRLEPPADVIPADRFGPRDALLVLAGLGAGVVGSSPASSCGASTRRSWGR